MPDTSKLIQIKKDTYLGKTEGVIVPAKPLLTRGYKVMGRDLINVGIDECIDPNYKYFLYTKEVIVVS